MVIILVRFNGDWIREGHRPIISEDTLNLLIKENNNCAWITR